MQNRIRVALAFLAIYLIWGSTFLATRYAVETIPPFFVSGTRFFLAGLILVAYAQMRQPERITLPQAAASVWMGALFFLICHGGVSWAAQYVPSGVSALLMSSISLWTAILEVVRGHSTRPGRRTIVALVVGFIGIALLVIHPEVLAGREPGSLGALVVLGSAVSWAAGTVLAKNVPKPSSTALAAGMQMTAGGGLLLITGFATGQSDRFHWSAITPQAVWSMVFLTLIGSLVGFTCYLWLLGRISPTRVATYAYVNPIVALMLGWMFGGEHPTMWSFIASGIVIGSVATVISSREPALVNQEKAEVVGGSPAFAEGR
ncbi:MAG: EamA family transporter [Bryobacteraceae bacterium]